MRDRVRLRPHHLLCILTFVGVGYTPEFIANQTMIVKRIGEGAEVKIAEGLDDICAALHNATGVLCASGDHCLQSPVTQRDAIALASIGVALDMEIKTGSTLKLEAKDWATMRRLFADGTLRTACKGCEWHALCSGVAADGFKQTLLRP